MRKKIRRKMREKLPFTSCFRLCKAV
jgi:hypothetical protein